MKKNQKQEYVLRVLQEEQKIKKMSEGGVTEGGAFDRK